MKRTYAIMIGFLALTSMIFGQKVSLRWENPYNQSNTALIWNNVIPEFEKLNPNIEVVIEDVPWADVDKKYIIQSQAGNPPDLLITCSGSHVDFYRMGLVEPLNSYVKEDFKSLFIPEAFNYYSDGSIVSIQQWINPYALLVKPHLLKKAGFSTKDIKTWQDFKKVATAMTKDTNKDGVIDVFGYAVQGSYEVTVNRMLQLWAYSNGFSLNDFSDKSKKKYLEMLSFMQSLSATLPPDSYTWTVNEIHQAWNTDKIASVIDGMWFYDRTRNVAPELMKPDTFAAIPFPKGPSSDDKSVMNCVLNVQGVLISKGSKYKNEAWTFMKYLLGKENQLKWFPAEGFSCYNKYVTDDLKNSTYAKEVYGNVNDFLFYYEQYIPLMKKSKAELLWPNTGDIYRTIIIEWDKLMHKQHTPQQTFDELKAAFTKASQG